MFRRPPSVPSTSVGTWSQKPCRRSSGGRQPTTKRAARPAMARLAIHPFEKRVVASEVGQVVELVSEGVSQQVFPTFRS